MARKKKAPAKPAAPALQIIEVTDRLAFVTRAGAAALLCYACRHEGEPEPTRRRRRLRKPYHRAFCRWRRSFKTDKATREKVEREPVLMLVIECGACGIRLKRQRADRVPGSDHVPIVNDKPAPAVEVAAQQGVLFA
jgi:hypothetical protein